MNGAFEWLTTGSNWSGASGIWARLLQHLWYTMLALAIGCCQVLALIPGVSRSGATILGGFSLGLARVAATEFSFFLALPTMCAATLFDLFKSRDALSVSDVPIFAIGFIVAFLSALVVIRSFLKFVTQHDFRGFAVYRILFGGLVLYSFWHTVG